MSRSSGRPCVSPGTLIVPAMKLKSLLMGGVNNAHCCDFVMHVLPTSARAITCSLTFEVGAVNGSGSNIH